MKFKSILLFIFCASFVIGLTIHFVTKVNNEIVPLKQNEITEERLYLAIPEDKTDKVNEIGISSELSEELKDWKNDDESKFKVKMLQVGDFHAMDVKEKSSKNWIGLFNENDVFELKKTNVKVEKIPDILGNDEGQLSGRRISINNDSEPLFLLKNADFLKEGKVKTIFSSPEGIILRNGFSAEYQIQERIYKLSVVGKENSSTMILESEGEKQILYSVENMGDAGWDLYWVGDLDGDGKLDLFANLTDYYNFLEPRLFISSKAKKGKLIEQIAFFHMTGC